jgi:hypothetical protein
MSLVPDIDGHRNRERTSVGREREGDRPLPHDNVSTRNHHLNSPQSRCGQSNGVRPPLSRDGVQTVYYRNRSNVS